MHALATQSVSSRLRQPERSLPAGRVIHRPKLAIGTGRAVRGYLRWLVAVWVFGDEREPTPGGFGDAAAFLAAEHRGSIPIECRVKRPTAPSNPGGMA